MDRGAWWAAVHGVTKCRAWLSDFTFTFHFHALEKEMATHSSVLAWRIPGTGEPGELPSVGSHRVGHDWSDLAAAAAAQQPKFLFFKASNAPRLWLGSSTIWKARRGLQLACYSTNSFAHFVEIFSKVNYYLCLWECTRLRSLEP